MRRVPTLRGSLVRGRTASLWRKVAAVTYRGVAKPGWGEGGHRWWEVAEVGDWLHKEGLIR